MLVAFRTMANPLYEFIAGPSGPQVRIEARGQEVLNVPMLNRGTAFTWPERHALRLTGLLPPGTTTIEAQVRRTYERYCGQSDNLAKYSYLSALRDRNEVLFYRLISEHIEEMMPIIYTPTIGEVIQRFSHGFNKLRAVFTSVDYPDQIPIAFENFGLASDECDLIVVTDSEGILGIGDQGIGGVQIALGKLAVYTAAAGIDPRRVIPVVIDVGTDNMDLLYDEFYLGARHSRIRGKAYDDFMETFVETVTRMYPNALLHWEDFGADNAHRVLEKYRDRCCSFNDDIQGTAAVVMAAVLAGVKTVGHKLREQRVVIFGAGTAGVGIADLLRDRMVREGLSKDEASRNFWCLGSKGLIHTGLGDKMRDFQRPYARNENELTTWGVQDVGNVDLLEVVRNVQPTILIGTSARSGAFTEEIVREMAAHVERPIILPLSNPTSRAEAVPADILEWTEGRALVATGSPFKPVDYNGVRYEIAQANNALVFPGLGLGVIVSKASRVSDRMIAAAAEAVADIQGVVPRGKSLLPSVNHLRMASGTVAVKVAQAAHAEGLSTVKLADPVQEVFEAMWQPAYPEILLPEGDWQDYDEVRARQRHEARKRQHQAETETPPAKAKTAK
ncbi:malate dehydrogenase (oxaloacetate-decarboxylating) [Propioniciclava tarda]|nr:malate dehydrogenase (oxaloacetate-decarboxylating) [Propioniciclava tarda]